MGNYINGLYNQYKQIDIVGLDILSDDDARLLDMSDFDSDDEFLSLDQKKNELCSMIVLSIEKKNPNSKLMENINNTSLFDDELYYLINNYLKNNKNYEKIKQSLTNIL